VAGVLGDERDDRGQHEQDERPFDVGQVPAGDLGTVRRQHRLGRKPNQSASRTGSKFTRSCANAVATQYGPSGEQEFPSASRRFAPGRTEVICPKRSKIHESTYPRTRPRKMAMRPMNRRRPTAMAMTATGMISAIHWSWGQ
jgi:hypothetical protein